ncbi:MAG TPA: molybdenum cofactor biosynthesis protein MoaB [Bacillus bacterium]|uniref:Molybdenum cofactor biosynthesis protein B n=1 Tax=Siminovitchia fordii TaxID=254759 RepID=A0ABQ4KBX5_9BACI|nr:molybdenum cofactor biosynthesis protein B [Siminovitchia fordii]GIN23242.1 molybdenum cofactor biosynthesis protein B [Siminovitchia fordii]HBZ09662.1 molybdenum cofactor biosynthesis protein MoaB [Bacillus sp. (in: firmicutes)]
MSVHQHKKQAPASVNCAVITVSDTRTEETDKSGKLMKSLLQENGHEIGSYSIVKDDKDAIISSFREAADSPDIQAVLINGGTGIAKRDITIETISPFFEKEIIGFGELFRMISYLEDIGSAAIMSRATAGTYKNKAVFVTPGSSGAVRTAMEKLILKELGHVIRELKK